MTSIYLIPGVTKVEIDQVLTQLTEFAFDSELIRAAHVSNDLYVEVEGGLGPNVESFSERIKRNIFFAFQYLPTLGFVTVYDSGGEMD